MCSTAAARDPPVLVSGRNLTINGEPLYFKGVAWNPYGVGTSPNFGHAAQFAQYVDEDSRLMRAAGINLVRTYSSITSTAVLDTLWANGIYVLMTIFYDAQWGDTVATAADRACALKAHPAIVAWLVMNEPNYYYGSANYRTDAEAAVQAIKAVDSSRPVA
eukprot:3530937-Prymnesium_polylepis.1